MLREFFEEILMCYATRGTLQEYIREVKPDQLEVSPAVIRAIMLVQDFTIFSAIVFTEKRDTSDVEIICSRGAPHERVVLNELRENMKKVGRSVFSLHQAVRYTNAPMSLSTASSPANEDTLKSALRASPGSGRTSSFGNRVQSLPKLSWNDFPAVAPSQETYVETPWESAATWAKWIEQSAHRCPPRLEIAGETTVAVVIQNINTPKIQPQQPATLQKSSVWQ
jgi:hypothetical protein